MYFFLFFFIPAAALALIDQPGVGAEEIVRRSMKIAGDICVYTNHNVLLEIIDPVAIALKKQEKEDKEKKDKLEKEGKDVKVTETEVVKEVVAEVVTTDETPTKY